MRNALKTALATVAAAAAVATPAITLAPSASAAANVPMSTALYVDGGGRLTAGFDGYQTTSGRHEGIDFARGAGSAVRSLTGGVVTSVNESSSLSTIAIYNATQGKTVIYLHTDPRNSLAVGQSVTRGQVIANEASRGASAAHTHVEMRPGRQTNASKSVGDPTLDNPDPTSFWNARGYDER